jgi:hypothetical protein
MGYKKKIPESINKRGLLFMPPKNMILMNDFKAEPIEIREAMLEATKRTLDSGWYVLGNEVLSFKRQWANSCAVMHGIGVGNGMDTIEGLEHGQVVAQGTYEQLFDRSPSFRRITGVI